MQKTKMTPEQASRVSASLLAVVNNPLSESIVLLNTSQKRALQSKSPLIIGDKSAGKSTVARSFSDKTQSFMCFSMGGASDSMEPSVMLALLSDGYSAYDIWRASVFNVVSSAQCVTKHDWSTIIQSMKQNPENTAKTMLDTKGDFQFLFDDVDELGQHLSESDLIVVMRDLLRVVLWVEQYRHMKAHVFVTPKLANMPIYNFPDASKILARKSEISWDTCSLSVLLWTILINTPNEIGDFFRVAFCELYGDPSLLKSDGNIFSIDTHAIKAQSFNKKNLKWLLARLGVTRLTACTTIAEKTTPAEFLNAVREMIVC